MKKRSLLRVLRAAHQPKVSQSQIARKAGMALYRYWQIENGDGPVATDAEKSAVAAALNAKVSDIDWPHAQQMEQSA